MSLVLVLPEDPVSPTTCSGSNCSRHQEASDCRAVSVSCTSTTVASGSQPSGMRETTTTAAPLWVASAAKLLPSKRSPLRARKIQPGTIRRLSVVSPAVMARCPVTTAVPAVARMRSAGDMLVMVGRVSGCRVCGRERNDPPDCVRRSIYVRRRRPRNQWFRP